MNLQQAQVISNSEKVRGAVSLRDDFNHFRRKYLTYSLLPFTSYLGVLHFATLPLFIYFFRSGITKMNTKELTSSR